MEGQEGKLIRPDLSIVVVNFNSGKLLRRCLDSAYQNLKGLSFEIIVVDNGSIDGSPRMVTQEFPQVRLICNKTNAGFARAVNQGIRASRGRYVLIVNPDVVFLNKGFKELIRYMDSNPRVGIAGPKVYDDETKRSVQLSCRRFPSPMNYLFSRYSLLTRLFPNNPFSRRFLLTDWSHDAIREVDWVSGCCMLVRRELLEKLGLFDEGYPLFFEDVDLCFRARNAGWKVVYFPGAEIAHFVGSVRAQMPFRNVIKRHQGLWRFYKKFYCKHKIAAPFVFLLIYLRMVYLLSVIFFKRYAPFFLDLILIQCALALSYLARSIVEFPWFERAIRSYLNVAPWYMGVQLFLLYVFELYEPARSRYHDYLDVLPRVVKAVSLGTVMLVFIAFFFREFYLPRSIVLLGWLFNVLLLTGWRWAHLWISQRHRPPKRVLIYGTGALAELVRDEILRRPALKLLPVGFVRSPAEPETSRVEPILGTLGDLQLTIREKNVDEVIYAPDKRSNEELRVLVEQCEQVRVDAQIAPDLFEIVTGRVHLEHFGLPLLDPVTIASHRAYLRLKRLFDVVVSGLALIFLSPLMALIAVAVKLNSPGPVLFRQRRVGKDGKEFVLYKFRTMFQEPGASEGMGEENLERLTRVGRFLRLTRLDELPQLFNVLKGEMSLVGPRAECVTLARKMAQEIPYFEERFRVRPGMTGWAQVEFKYTTSVEEYKRKLQYDLYYIKNMSFSLDLIILVKTLWVVLTGKGAR